MELDSIYEALLPPLIIDHQKKPKQKERIFLCGDVELLNKKCLLTVDFTFNDCSLLLLSSLKELDQLEDHRSLTAREAATRLGDIAGYLNKASDHAGRGDEGTVEDIGEGAGERVRCGVGTRISNESEEPFSDVSKLTVMLARQMQVEMEEAVVHGQRKLMKIKSKQLKVGNSLPVELMMEQEKKEEIEKKEEEEDRARKMILTRRTPFQFVKNRSTLKANIS
ncbi:hypothetical protein BLNAU_23679 [Blattamonas nauphoetae]|uniref:Uncharacterized protein n=1 Tax=Blattamonas nauphoetae TaxID=2049346 RepID=A0ABQ9WSH5_9EUKA|nr:hypothetical protein BLNAU_23679 [Blattamonas nauphoetae]